MQGCAACFKFKVGHLGELPKEVPPEVEKNEDFLRKAHHVLLEVNFFSASFAFVLISHCNYNARHLCLCL